MDNATSQQRPKLLLKEHTKRIVKTRNLLNSSNVYANTNTNTNTNKTMTKDCRLLTVLQ